MKARLLVGVPDDERAWDEVRLSQT